MTGLCVRVKMTMYYWPLGTAIPTGCSVYRLMALPLVTHCTALCSIGGHHRSASEPQRYLARTSFTSLDLRALPSFLGQARGRCEPQVYRLDDRISADCNDTTECIRIDEGTVRHYTRWCQTTRHRADDRIRRRQLLLVVAREIQGVASISSGRTTGICSLRCQDGQ